MAKHSASHSAGPLPGSQEEAGRQTPLSPMREAHLRIALEAAGMVTWEWDIPGDRILYSDNVPEVACGTDTTRYCSAAELLAQLHPDDRDGFAKTLARTIGEGHPFECEYRVRMLDGAYHWILGKGKIVVVEDGKPVRVLGISQDITARKLAEQELLRRSQQLATLASELTLTESRQQRLLAERLHGDLQQLLVGARMQARALAERSDPALHQPLADLASVITEALESSRSIVSDLASPVLLHGDLAGALAWLAREMSRRHGLTVTVRAGLLPDPLPEAVQVLFYTAASELLLNVVKYAGTARAELAVGIAGQSLEMTVADDGRGYDPALPGRSGAGRTGLGLFSIRERAEPLGGTLAVASSPGHGTTVSLRLPVQG